MTSSAQHPNSGLLERVMAVRVKVGPVRWEVRSAKVAEAIGDLLSRPDDFAGRTAAVIRETWLVTVARVPVPALSEGSWLLRRSNYAKSSARKRDFLRTGAAVRAFRNALALEEAGQPTPRVLAAGVRRVLRVPRAGYLVVEEVPGAVSLAELAQSPQGAARAMIRAVTEAIARLHEHGFIHGDLTINNVLLDRAGRPWFIDLERTRQVRGAVTWRQAIEDFHRIARHFNKFSPAGRVGALRLLKDYCSARGWRGREREFVKALARLLKHKIEADRSG